MGFGPNFRILLTGAFWITVKDNMNTLLPIRCKKRLIREKILVEVQEDILLSFRSERFLKAQIQFSFSNKFFDKLYTW